MMNKAKIKAGLKMVGRTSCKVATFVVIDVLPKVVMEGAKLILNSDTSSPQQKQRAANTLKKYENQQRK